MAGAASKEAEAPANTGAVCWEAKTPGPTDATSKEDEAPTEHGARSGKLASNSSASTWTSASIVVYSMRGTADWEGLLKDSETFVFEGGSSHTDSLLRHLLNFWLLFVSIAFGTLDSLFLLTGIFWGFLRPMILANDTPGRINLDKVLILASRNVILSLTLVAWTSLSNIKTSQSFDKDEWFPPQWTHEGASWHCPWNSLLQLMHLAGKPWSFNLHDLMVWPKTWQWKQRRGRGMYSLIL